MACVLKLISFTENQMLLLQNRLRTNFSSSADLQRQSLEWMICQRVMLLSRKTWTSWRNGLTWTLWSSTRRMQSPALGKEQACCDSDRALRQVTQRVCAVSLPGGVQKPFGHGPGQPALGGPAWARRLDQMNPSTLGHSVRFSVTKTCPEVKQTNKTKQNNKTTKQKQQQQQ